MNDSSQYGLLNNNRLSYEVIALAQKYAKYRLFSPNMLSYEETLYYNSARSCLHDEIAEALDLDRELVEEAFEEATKHWNRTLVARRDIEVFDEVHSAFCDKLEEFANFPLEKRHRIFDVEKVDLSDLNGIPSL